MRLTIWMHQRALADLLAMGIFKLPGQRLRRFHAWLVEQNPHGGLECCHTILSRTGGTRQAVVCIVAPKWAGGPTGDLDLSADGPANVDALRPAWHSRTPRC